jgi:hypothetical protein
MILVARHELEELVKNLIMKDNLVIGVLQVLQILQYVLDSALVMRNGVLEQQQIVDVCIVSELI